MLQLTFAPKWPQLAKSRTPEKSMNVGNLPLGAFSIGIPIGQSSQVCCASPAATPPAAASSAVPTPPAKVESPGCATAAHHPGWLKHVYLFLIFQVWGAVIRWEWGGNGLKRSYFAPAGRLRRKSVIVSDIQKIETLNSWVLRL